MIVLREAIQIKVTDAAQVAAVFRDLLALEDLIARDTEHYYVMHLDVRHTVKLVELVSIGVLDSARVHPRETFRRAIVEGSASIGLTTTLRDGQPLRGRNPRDRDAAPGRREILGIR